VLRAYILSYDISSPKRLRAMHKIAKAFGRPLQYSVFACTLRREDRVRLAQQIEGLIDKQKDRVVIVDMGGVADRESWILPVEVFGRQTLSADPPVVIV